MAEYNLSNLFTNRTCEQQQQNPPTNTINSFIHSIVNWKVHKKVLCIIFFFIENSISHDSTQEKSGNLRGTNYMKVNLNIVPRKLT